MTQSRSRRPARPPASARSRRRGFIVVAVLWIMMALATVASIASVYVAQSATALSLVDAPAESEALITAGLELTALQLSSRAVTPAPTRGGFAFHLGRADLRVEYLAEAARIDLNGAGKELLTGLFQSLGAAPEAAAAHADRIVAWRKRLKPSAEAEEREHYRAAGLAYGPRQMPFDSADELWLVPGLPPGLVQRAMPLVTVHTGANVVNILDAPPEIMAALPGMTPLRLADFLSRRAAPGVEPKDLLDALGPRQVGAGVGAAGGGGEVYRVRMRIAFPDGRRQSPEVVVKLGGGRAPYTVLSWRDDIDPGTGTARLPGETR